MSFTVYEITHFGREMNKARDNIQSILDESSLSVFHKIMVLDLMAFEMKKENI